MVISRTNESPPEARKYLDDILRWDTMALIVPEVVIIETKRNIPKLVDDIAVDVNNMIETLNNSHWLNIEYELPKYKGLVRETTKSLHEYRERLINNRENYIKGLNLLVSRLFEKAIIVKTDEKLIYKVNKR
ncbi:hypothetical protein GNF98_20450, partial [Clostridium perfringens]